MKKNFLDTKRPQVKVARLKNTAIENGIIVFVALLLVTNLVISLKILFG